MVYRFFYRLWLCEKVLIRNRALNALDLYEFVPDSEMRTLKNIEELHNHWNDNLVEPDDIIKPAKDIFDKFVAPIIRKRENGVHILKTDKQGTSMILFGPPGSGKTFFVNTVAKYVNWPLVELSPGNFISRGLESIEANSRELFECLSCLNHTVVFFDECDELFRRRSSDDQSFRSILSFITASMLPKLQKLHDDRNIIFIVGTNLLSNMDKAIIRPGRFDRIYLFDRPDANAISWLISKYETQKH